MIASAEGTDTKAWAGLAKDPLQGWGQWLACQELQSPPQRPAPQQLARPVAIEGQERLGLQLRIEFAQLLFERSFLVASLELGA